MPLFTSLYMFCFFFLCVRWVIPTSIFEIYPGLVPLKMTCQPAVAMRLCIDSLNYLTAH